MNNEHPQICEARCNLFFHCPSIPHLPQPGPLFFGIGPLRLLVTTLSHCFAEASSVLASLLKLPNLSRLIISLFHLASRVLMAWQRGEAWLALLHGWTCSVEGQCEGGWQLKKKRRSGNWGRVPICNPPRLGHRSENFEASMPQEY